MKTNLLKKITSIVCATLAVTALALPASAADKVIPQGVVVIAMKLAEVDTINVINRDLHASYAVTNANDKAAIMNALNAIEYRQDMKVTPEMDGLRLLQIRDKDGEKYDIWCHENVLMAGGTQLAEAAQLKTLYSVMDRCEKAYPANIEWLGYMNPYRITTMSVEKADGSASVSESAKTAAQRDAILNVSKALKAVKVGYVQKHNSPKATPAGKWDYVIRLDFEENAEHYEIHVGKDGRLYVSVDSIDYDLTYDSNDAVLFSNLTAALSACF